jgi:hypothetical protein
LILPLSERDQIRPLLAAALTRLEQLVKLAAAGHVLVTLAAALEPDTQREATVARGAWPRGIVSPGFGPSRDTTPCWRRAGNHSVLQGRARKSWFAKVRYL